MKYGETIQVIAKVVGAVIGIVFVPLVYFGGAYLAFAEYGVEGGFLWLFPIGILAMGPTGIVVMIVAVTIGAILAPFVMAVRAMRV